MRAPATDVLIRGAGPVGCALALALHAAGIRVALHEREARPSAASFRPIALSYASRLILERVGVWDALAPTPIETVHVSQAGGFGRTRLEATDAGVPALGYVVEYADLAAALRGQVGESGVERVDRDIAARCEVHAEGSAPDAEEKPCAQHALVALVELADPAGTTAYERFTANGPLAMLPLRGRYAIVWSTRPEHARALAGAAEAEFLAELAATAGSHPGRPVAVQARAVHPLALRVRSARVATRAVYIGNAAQTLHPVAGQGLNLGLRDALDLAQILREAPDPGDAGTLARYASLRRLDAEATVRVTDLLAGAFLGTGRIARAARGLALTALDVLPAPRRFFARRMIYGPSALP